MVGRALNSVGRQRFCRGCVRRPVGGSVARLAEPAAHRISWERDPDLSATSGVNSFVAFGAEKSPTRQQHE